MEQIFQNLTNPSIPLVPSTCRRHGIDGSSPNAAPMLHRDVSRRGLSLSKGRPSTIDSYFTSV